MSYILDALKKSDEQRQRGATPTLPSAQTAPATTKLSFFGYYGVYAAILLCAGIAIGWWQPWQVEQPVRVAEPVAVIPALPHTDQSTMSPRPAHTEMAVQPEQGLPAPSPAPVFSAQEPVSQVDMEQKATPLSELPLAIQQELPEMKIQLHSYSNMSANSIVSINSRMMKEGDSLAPGLRLEQITPDGVILSFKGYRFQRGIY